MARPLVIGFGNYLSPTAVHVLEQGGAVALRRLAVRSSALLFGLVSLFFVFVVGWGESLLRILYGAKAAENRGVLVVLTGAMAVVAVGMPYVYALYASNRPNAHFVARVVATAVTLGSCLYLVGATGPLGAATSLMLGAVPSTAIVLWAYLRGGVPQGATDAIWREAKG